MQIVLMATGTRGDVQPMIALGLALKQVGHQVRVVAGSNFITWIESFGLEAFPTIDIEALMQSPLGLKWVEGEAQLQQLRALKALMESVIEPLIESCINSTQGADLIICGFVSEPYMQAIGEKRGIPVIGCGLQPYRNTRSGAASVLPLLPQRDSRLNRWMGTLTESMTWLVFSKGTNLLRQRLGLVPHNARSYSRAAFDTIPALYAVSPGVVPPTDDTNSYTTGYWFLDEPFTPPNDLVQFIKAGDAPVYVGFGSMSSSDPSRTVALVAEALARVGRRGVLARGWSKAQIADVPEHLFVLDKAPHTWLFPQMAAVVHHGGAGTTAAGLRAGIPSLIIPHMADQPYWARRVHELGVGPKPIKRHHLSVAALTKSLDTLLNTPSIRVKADALGDQIRSEQGIENAVEWIQAFIQKRHA